jgi:aquaporin Z
MKYFVEFLGTLLFLFVILQLNNPLATGAILAVAIMLGGHISGGHFNPAVTITMANAGKIPYSEVMPYIIAQIAGGLCAFEIKKLL